MHNDTKNFLNDLIKEIQEKYDQTLIPEEGEDLSGKNYRLGMNFSYYDVLEVIESQLKSFGFSTEEFGRITPMLGEKS
ncbi:hypothetical protein [Paenibacillus phocaensis]|uniref:hypothetical protein n=1 Tax=Paenibacillus phocaensis TaxID=1776378 RepID=UPI000839B49E|nr:hypothetical protein [Paenibacillus phocaensis]